MEREGWESNGVPLPSSIHPAKRKEGDPKKEVPERLWYCWVVVLTLKVSTQQPVLSLLTWLIPTQMHLFQVRGHVIERSYFTNLSLQLRCWRTKSI